MKVKARNLKFVLLPALVFLLLVSFSVSAFAITESEVQAQVNAAGKESVTGNVLIWFLCAVAFLKVSQKIDSFMASLGVNVGHTGGSMLSEALIVTRAISSAANVAGRAFGGGRSGSSGSSSGGGSSGATSASSFFHGGLAGIVSRAVTNNAVKAATESNATANSVQDDLAREAVYAASQSGSGDTIHSPSQGQQGAAGGTALSPPGLSGGGAPVGMPGTVDNVMPALTQSGIGESGSIVGLAAEADSEENGAVPITVPADPGISVSMAATDGEDHFILAPSPAQDGGEGTVINYSAETDASTLVETTSENLSAALTNNAAQTINAPDNPPLAETNGGTGGVTLRQQNNTGQNMAASKETVSHSESSTHTASGHATFQAHTHGIGGAMFMKSLASGGSFANEVIGRVATGDVKTTGTISGDMASQALTCYMGMNAIGTPPASVPSYTDVEIGGGRITGIETAPGGQSIQFAMYNSAQYTTPQGDYTKVVSADGATWYKQYAQNTVDRKPYNAPDKTVAYKETIVQRMPNPPRRKDKI